jgi:hypothetical protein
LKPAMEHSRKRIKATREPLFSEECQTGAVALDCEMVGGGKDGSINICARVCLVDEHENVLLNTYVQPVLPVTDYRFVILLIFRCVQMNLFSEHCNNFLTLELLCLLRAVEPLTATTRM